LSKHLEEHSAVVVKVVLDSIITHTSAWFLDREIHQFVIIEILFPCVSELVVVW